MDMFDFLQSLLSSAHYNTINKINGFWYVGQAHRYRGPANSNFMELRKPTMSEFNAQTMLALSYGAKGLMFYNYYSWGTENDLANDFNQGLVDNNFNKRDLWYKLKELISNRIRNTLGNTLKDLVYLGDSLDLKRIGGNFEVSRNYITLKRNIVDSTNFHVGFFKHKNDQNDKYFFIVNLICPSDTTRTLNIKLQRPSSSYQNYSLYNVEGGYNWSYFDTTNFNIVFKPGDGNLFRVTPVIKYGGIIRANETISSSGETLKGPLTIASGATLTVNGTYNVYNDITINSGGTLAVNSGKSLVFYNGAKVIVNGTLTANGTSSQRITFNFSSIDASGNGILINSGGTASISYCNISNAYYGVRCLGGLTSFTNNTVTNNNTGLQIENTNISQITNSTISNNSYNGITAINAEFNFSNNYVRDNSSTGIYCYDGTSLTIRNNSITGNSQYGVFVNYNSEGFIAYSSSYTNLITGNRYGVYSNLSSTAYLNYNCLYNNNKNSTTSSPGYEVIVNNSSSAEAEYNWWGAATVDPNRIHVASGSVIDYTNPLQTSPCTGMSKIGSSGSKEIVTTDSYGDTFGVGTPVISTPRDIELDSASQLRSAKKYDEAIAFYDKIIAKEVSTQKAVFALIGMSNSYRESKKTGFTDYMTKSIRSKNSDKTMIYAVSLELENNLLIAEKRYKDILNNLAKLKTNYTDYPGITKNAIFKTGYIYITYLNDTVSAKTEFDLLASKFPNDELVYLSESLMGTLKSSAGKSGSGNTNSKDAKNTIPSEYLLEQNYPNPFNPTTNISYSLPVDSKVNITVYNSLGQAVRILVDGVKSPGRHTVTFNANQLPSGVYFYQLTAQSLDGSRKDYQSNKKMLLIK